MNNLNTYTLKQLIYKGTPLTFKFEDIIIYFY
jgi:hypothetical protein